MDDKQTDQIFEAMTKPKYTGIDGFFAVLAVLVLVNILPLTVLAWRAAF